MSVIRQVALLPAGCQPWNLNVVSARGGEYFAYAATLAVYVYKHEREFSDFRLHAILTEHNKTVTSIDWHPVNDNLLLTASCDPRICVWDVMQHSLLLALDHPRCTPLFASWVPGQGDMVAYLEGRGPVHFWEAKEEGTKTQMKEIPLFSSSISQMRWHPKKPATVAFGHYNSTISVHTGNKLKRHISLHSSDEKACNSDENPVTALEWDPQSTNYLLVALCYSKIILVDVATDGVQVVTTYTAPSRATMVRSVAWIPAASGMFITGDLEAGVLRVWNVARSTPLENILLKQTGFHALHVMCGSHDTSTHGKSSINSKDQVACNNGASKVQSKTMDSTRGYEVPKAKVVSLFGDGGVGVYSLRSRRWDFLREMGHIETIFDCQFKPDNSDLLATGSFDGTIRVWNINGMTSEMTSPGGESIIYSISWAPGDLNCIAAATSKRGVVIWNLTRGFIVRRFMDHGLENAVYCVAWNCKDSRKIASGGEDGTCMVHHHTDGQLIQAFKHPGTVYGCDWNAENENILATSCEDGMIRIFYLPSPGTQPLKTLSGHTAKAFRVKWSPLNDGILCSSSDDCTIRVWDYASGTSISVLEGHTQYARGLLWNTEIPYILMSGSWDRTIRVWDIRSGKCIDLAEDHGADVYGLSCHPDRPFLIASSSRDSTVRLWTLQPLVSQLYAQILVHRPWSEIIASSAENNKNLADMTLLCGQKSKALKYLTNKNQEAKCHVILQQFSELFSCPFGLNNLWDLVFVIKDEKSSKASASYNSGITHRKHLVKYHMSTTQELELVKMTRFGAGGVGTRSKEECLRAAAERYLMLGNLKQYCELKFELGDWEDAISVAPGVSLEFWRSLLNKRAEMLYREENQKALPYLIAMGDVFKVIDLYRSQGQLQDAYTVAVAAAEGNFRLKSSRKQKVVLSESETKDLPIDNLNSCVSECVEQLAEWNLRSVSPVQASCYYLAVDAVKEALQTLVRGHELELAISIANVLGEWGPVVHTAVGYLAWRYSKIGNWNLALEILDLIPDEAISNELKFKLCASCSKSREERTKLYSKAGLPSVEECFSLAKENESNSKTIDIVKLFLLSPKPDHGLELGIQHIKEIMSRPHWKLDDVWEMTEVVRSIRTQSLHMSDCGTLKPQLLFLSAYIGSLMAIHQRFTPVVHALLNHSWVLLKRIPDIKMPVDAYTILIEREAWDLHQKANNSDISPEHQYAYQMLMQKVGGKAADGDVGETRIIGSHLPRHSNQNKSIFDNSVIQGPVFILEDGVSAIALNEALMWAKVNPFSPLGTGERINPY